MKLVTLFAASALSMMAGFASADNHGKYYGTPAPTDAGYEMLADAKGMILYTFDNDEHEVSKCYGGCEADWSPFYAKSEAVPYGHFTLHKRTDDSYQWVWQGKPLYYWRGDKNPGDKGGDGMGGLWHVVHR